MRTRFFVLLLACLPFTSYAQGDLEALFSKYSDTDGFLSLTISGSFLNFVKDIDDDGEKGSLPSGVTGIRLLTRDNDRGRLDENFYDAALKLAGRKDYEEFMRVKGSGSQMIMLARCEGKVIKELIVASEGEDDVLIQIKGSMTEVEARRFSNMLKKEGCKNLAGI